MTEAPAELRPRPSRGWSVVFRVGYRFLRLLDPLIRSWIANGLPGLGAVVELRFVGRRTGRPRRVLVTMLHHDGAWYVGHPNGDAAWVRSIEAAGSVEVEPSGASGPRVRAIRVPPGAERDGVIRATWTQQPFPADMLYRAARRHVAAVGVYLRLEPLPSAPTNAAAETPGAHVPRS